MNLYSGAYFCSKNNWDGLFFHATYLVTINSYDIAFNEYGNEDFLNLIDSKDYFDTQKYNDLSLKGVSTDILKVTCMKTCNYLKPHVYEWLEKNVQNDPKVKKAWCVGNDEYNSNQNEDGFSIFFYRRKDALNFIKTFSVNQQPTETYNQKTYTNKKLNLKNKKLEIVED